MEKKRRRRWRASLLLALVLLCGAEGAKGQRAAAGKEEKHALALSAALKARRYVFTARFLMLSNGRQRMLTPEYYGVRVTPDSLRIVLPYVGRAYSVSAVPLNPAEGGVQVATARYSQQIKPRRQKGWTVTLHLPAERDVRRLVFTVVPDGGTSLYVTFNGRDPAYYDGVVTVQ